MKNKILFLSAILAASAYGAIMDLEQVLQEVKKNSYNLQVSEKNLEIRKLEEKKAFKNLLPNVDLKLSKDLLNSGENSDSNDFGSDKLTIPITVYSGGRKLNNYKIKKIDAGIAEKEVRRTEQREEIRAIDLLPDTQPSEADRNNKFYSPSPKKAGEPSQYTFLQQQDGKQE